MIFFNNTKFDELNTRIATTTISLCGLLEWNPNQFIIDVSAHRGEVMKFMSSLFYGKSLKQYQIGSSEQIDLYKPIFLPVKVL